MIATLSSDAAAIAGRVTDDLGRQLDDYRVIAFSVDRLRWFAGSPYVRMTAGPNPDGEYVIQDLPPGDYFVAALDGVEGDALAGEWQATEFLGGLTLAARRVSAGERQRVAADLRIRLAGRR